VFVRMPAGCEPLRVPLSMAGGNDVRPRQCPHPDAALRGQDADVLAYLLGECYPDLFSARH
jgi:hypothetical protein